MAMDPAENVPARLNRELEEAIKDFENEDQSPEAVAANPADDEAAEANAQTPVNPPPATDADPASLSSTADPAVDPVVAPAQDGGQTPDKAGGNTEAEDHTTGKPADDAVWEQRYRVLDGKYRAEVPRLQHRLQVALDEIGQLKARVDSSKPPANPDPKDKSTTMPAAPSATDPENPYGLSDQEREYGEEVISMAEKIARKIVGERLGSVESKAEQAAAEIERQRSESFFGELAVLVPDWRTVNDSQEFKDFCDQVEPNSGLPWQEIIDRAQNALDPVRVAHVMNSFRQGKNTGSKPPVSPAAITPVDEQVVPAPAATPPAPQGRKVYTLREYEQLMDNIIRGRYSQKQAAKIKAELDEAFSDGRIKE